VTLLTSRINAQLWLGVLNDEGCCAQCTTVNGVEVDISISGPGGVLAARFMANEVRAGGWTLPQQSHEQHDSLHINTTKHSEPTSNHVLNPCTPYALMFQSRPLTLLS
jgi:hypothetical protein